jgi:NADP-dependent 3-hydroxy acid dehydrogenase YdfG
MYSTDEDLHYNLSTNLYGVINTVNAFLPFLRQGQKKQIFVTSSWIGSLKHSTSSMATACKPFALHDRGSGEVSSFEADFGSSFVSRTG